MERGYKVLIACALSYLAVAIFTFGHSASYAADWQAKYCATRVARSEVGEACFVDPGITGLMGGIVWPLYWSWDLQQ